jgi:hypothetical protein
MTEHAYLTRNRTPSTLFGVCRQLGGLLRSLVRQLLAVAEWLPQHQWRNMSCSLSV